MTNNLYNTLSISDQLFIKGFSNLSVEVIFNYLKKIFVRERIDHIALGCQSQEDNINIIFLIRVLDVLVILHTLQSIRFQGAGIFIIIQPSSIVTNKSPL